MDYSLLATKGHGREAALNVTGVIAMMKPKVKSLVAVQAFQAHNNPGCDTARQSSQ